jgi:hypothetical protein
MDWIDLAQDKGRWRALVNAVMNLRVQKKMRGYFFTSGDRLVAREERTLLHGISKVSK